MMLEEDQAHGEFGELRHVLSLEGWEEVNRVLWW